MSGDAHGLSRARVLSKLRAAATQEGIARQELTAARIELEAWKKARRKRMITQVAPLIWAIAALVWAVHGVIAVAALAIIMMTLMIAARPKPDGPGSEADQIRRKAAFDRAADRYELLFNQLVELQVAHPVESLELLIGTPEAPDV